MKIRKTKDIGDLAVYGTPDDSNKEGFYQISTGTNTTNPTTTNPTNTLSNTSSGVGSTGGYSTGVYWATCSHCGVAYNSGSLHLCAATIPGSSSSGSSTVTIGTEEIAGLEDLRREIADTIAEVERYLGFVDDDHEVERLNEVSYYIREAMKIIRELEKDQK